MKLPHRNFLHLVAGAVALPAVLRVARTQASRPVHIIDGFAPGGSTDTTARLIGQWLWERLGQPFIVENRPDATGNIASESVVRASADGHTLLMVLATTTIKAKLYDNREPRTCRSPDVSA